MSDTSHKKSERHKEPTQRNANDTDAAPVVPSRRSFPVEEQDPITPRTPLRKETEKEPDSGFRVLKKADSSFLKTNRENTLKTPVKNKISVSSRKNEDARDVDITPISSNTTKEVKRDHARPPFSLVASEEDAPKRSKSTGDRRRKSISKTKSDGTKAKDPIIPVSLTATKEVKSDHARPPSSRTSVHTPPRRSQSIGWSRDNTKSTSSDSGGGDGHGRSTGAGTSSGGRGRSGSNMKRRGQRPSSSRRLGKKEVRQEEIIEVVEKLGIEQAETTSTGKQHRRSSRSANARG